MSTDSIQLSKVTSKGQTTIPVEIRRHLGIEPGSRVAFAIEGEQVVLRRFAPGDPAFQALANDAFEDWAHPEADKAFDGF